MPRIAKLCRELDTYQINFLPRILVKTQAIANFPVKLTIHKKMEPLSSANNNLNPWALYVNRSHNMHRSGFGSVLTFPEGNQIELGTRLNFKIFNNKVE